MVLDGWFLIGEVENLGERAYLIMYLLVDFLVDMLPSKPLPINL